MPVPADLIAELKSKYKDLTEAIADTNKRPNHDGEWRNLVCMASLFEYAVADVLTDYCRLVAKDASITERVAASLNRVSALDCNVMDRLLSHRVVVGDAHVNDPELPVLVDNPTAPTISAIGLINLVLTAAGGHAVVLHDEHTVDGPVLTFKPMVRA